MKSKYDWELIKMKKEAEENEFVHEKVRWFIDGKEINVDIPDEVLDTVFPSTVDDSKIRGGIGSDAIPKPLTLKEKILYAISLGEK